MEFKPQAVFQYDPLDPLQPSFRLCKLLPGTGTEEICCYLTNELTEESRGHYVALSYEWGRPTESPSIQLNNTKFHVQPNLFAALQAIRKPDEPLVLWIDALCINQLDLLERNHQVSQMGSIYTNAKLIYAWLGPEADDSDSIFEYLQHFSGISVRDRNGHQNCPIKSLPEEALRALCHREYWHRMWIKQEIVLAKEIRIYCGSRSLDWDTISTWAGMAVLSTINSEWKDESLNRLALHRTDLENGEVMPLQTLLLDYHMSRCKDVRDHVFALLSLASDCAGIQSQLVDYTIDPPTLFFALMAHFQPDVVPPWSMALQDALQVSRIDLENLWDRVVANENGTEIDGTSSYLKTTAVTYIQQVQEYAASRLWVQDLNHMQKRSTKKSKLLLPSKTCLFICLSLIMFQEGTGEIADNSPDTAWVMPIADEGVALLFQGSLFGAYLTGFARETSPRSASWEEFEPISTIPDNLIEETKSAYALLDEDRRKRAARKSLESQVYLESPKNGLPTLDSNTVCLILWMLRQNRTLCLTECRYFVTQVYGYNLRGPVSWKGSDEPEGETRRPKSKNWKGKLGYLFSPFRSKRND